LNANKYLTLVEELHSPGDIERVFREGRASLVVVFSENFHDNLLHTGECAVQLIADATQPAIAIGYVTGIISDYRQELMRDVNKDLWHCADTADTAVGHTVGDGVCIMASN